MQEDLNMNQYQQREKDRVLVEGYIEHHVGGPTREQAMAAFHRLMVQSAKGYAPRPSNKEVLDTTTVGSLFRSAEEVNAGKVVVKLFKDPDDTEPFRAVVVLNDEPRFNAKFLDAIDAVENELDIEDGVESALEDHVEVEVDPT